MISDPGFYFDILYLFQNRVVKIINQVDTNFYLTGGTAASRRYLEHRFSDDLHYFVNDDDRFPLWVERIIQALTQEWKCEIIQKEERFARLNLPENDFSLKIEMINDVPAHMAK